MGWAQLNVHTEADGSVMSSMSLRPDSETWARCCLYDDQAPIMTLCGPGGVHVSITPQAKTTVTRGELEFARALAAETARYAEECAKYFTPDDETGDESGNDVAGRVA